MLSVKATDLVLTEEKSEEGETHNQIRFVRPDGKVTGGEGKTNNNKREKVLYRLRTLFFNSSNTVKTKSHV